MGRLITWFACNQPGSAPRERQRRGDHTRTADILPLPLKVGTDPIYLSLFI